MTTVNGPDPLAILESILFRAIPHYFCSLNKECGSSGDKRLKLTLGSSRGKNQYALKRWCHFSPNPGRKWTTRPWWDERQKPEASQGTQPACGLFFCGKCYYPTQFQRPFVPPIGFHFFARIKWFNWARDSELHRKAWPLQVHSGVSGKFPKGITVANQGVTPRSFSQIICSLPTSHNIFILMFPKMSLHWPNLIIAHKITSLHIPSSTWDKITTSCDELTSSGFLLRGQDVSLIVTPLVVPLWFCLRSLYLGATGTFNHCYITVKKKKRGENRKE